MQGGGRLLLLGDIGVGHQDAAVPQWPCLHLKPRIAGNTSSFGVWQGFDVVRLAARRHGKEAVGYLLVLERREGLSEAQAHEAHYVGAGDRGAMRAVIHDPHSKRIVGLGPEHQHGQGHLLDDLLVEPTLDIFDGGTDDLAHLGHRHATGRVARRGERPLLLGHIDTGQQGAALAQRSHVNPKPALGNPFVAVPIDPVMPRLAPRGHGEDEAVGTPAEDSREHLINAPAHEW